MTRRATMTVEDMNAMTPLILISREDLDILCECGRPALFLTAGGADERGNVEAKGLCGECLPGDEPSSKPLPVVAFAGAPRRG